MAYLASERFIWGVILRAFLDLSLLIDNQNSKKLVILAKYSKDILLTLENFRVRTLLNSSYISPIIVFDPKNRSSGPCKSEKYEFLGVISKISNLKKL